MEASVPALWFETHADAFAELPCQGGGGRGAGVPRPQGERRCLCTPALGKGWGAASAQTPTMADLKLQGNATPHRLSLYNQP